MTPVTRFAATLAALGSLSLAVAAEDFVAKRVAETSDLRGTIGRGLKVKMHLEKRPIMRRENKMEFQIGWRYDGYYIYESMGKRIELRGDFNAQGIGGAADDPITEIEEFVDGRKTGVFIGHFDDAGDYRGKWETLDGKKELPFALRSVRTRTFLEP